jgi:hypothetical protein
MPLQFVLHVTERWGVTRLYSVGVFYNVSALKTHGERESLDMQRQQYIRYASSSPSLAQAFHSNANNLASFRTRV